MTAVSAVTRPVQAFSDPFNRMWSELLCFAIRLHGGWMAKHNEGRSRHLP